MKNHHENKEQRGTVECCHSQVHRADQALLPTLAHSFVACGRARVPHAPANLKGFNLLETEGGTHTQKAALRRSRAEPE